MLYQVKAILKNKIFDIRIRGIVKTQPFPTEMDSDVVLLTMLGHRAVLMYLLAAKSLLFLLPKCSLAILNDGSLRPNDIEFLKWHFPVVRIFNFSDVDTGSCPSGGCWERLGLVSSLVASSRYVLQFDSDTLAIGALDEVVACIESKRSFVLGTEVQQDLVSAVGAGKRWENSQNLHVQALAEKFLFKISGNESVKYVRGNAGFSGYAPNSFCKRTMENFSNELQGVLGKMKWFEWGSEQVTSNLILANTPGCTILPYPKYAPYEPSTEVSFDDSVFLHYYGTYRYTNGHYISSAKKVLRKIIL